MLLHAQYTDRNHCSIAFTSHKNQPGTLEQVKDNMIFQFIPNNDFWKIIIKNNNSEDAQINWEKASFIINGKSVRHQSPTSLHREQLYGYNQKQF